MNESIRRRRVILIVLLSISLLGFMGVRGTMVLAQEDSSHEAESPKAVLPYIEVQSRNDMLKVVARDADIRELLGEMAVKSGKEIEIGEGVEGKVTIEFDDLTLEESIRRILDQLGEKNFVAEYTRREGSENAEFELQKVSIVRGAKDSQLIESQGPEIPEEKRRQFLEALGSNNQRRIWLAFKELQKWGRASSSLLLESLEIDDVNIRLNAISQISVLGIREAVPSLVTLLEDGNEYVQQAAAICLGTLRDKRATTPLLEQAKRTQKAGLKVVIIGTLGFVGDESVVPYLEMALEDESKHVQIFAAGSLGMYGNKKGLELAEKFSQEADTQHAALQALGWIRDPGSLALLERIIEDPNVGKKNKQMAYIASRKIEFVNMDSEETLSILKEDIDKGEDISFWAMGELAEINNPEAIAILKNSYEQAEGNKKEMISRCLVSLGEDVNGE